MSDRVEGSVIAIHGALVRVQVGDKTMVVASRRKLHWHGPQPPVPRLVVGDQVILEVEGEEGVVVGAKARHSSLLRRTAEGALPLVLAANIDQALIVFAARKPRPYQDLLDRLLVSCHLAGINPVVVVNKKDQGLGPVTRWLDLYSDLDYLVLPVSARTGWGLGQIRRLLAERTTLFCGPAGVGKSALLNAVYPGFRLKSGSISRASGNTPSSEAELIPLPYNGFVIDSPALTEFGLRLATVAELEASFPEIHNKAAQCQAAVCSHTMEPGCQIQLNVNQGTIDQGRYKNYCALVEERDEDAG